MQRILRHKEEMVFSIVLSVADGIQRVQKIIFLELSMKNDDDAKHCYECSNESNFKHLMQHLFWKFRKCING